MFPEYYEEQETKQDRIMVKLTFFILSVLVAVIWIGVPFILAFIFIMSVIDDSGDKKQKEDRSKVAFTMAEKTSVSPMKINLQSATINAAPKKKIQI